MKGTLLLALLVIGELGFQTTEACIPFFSLFLSTVSGSRQWLHHELHYFNPTAGETAAFEKIQDCYFAAGTISKFLDTELMASLISSRECRTYYPIDTLKKIEGLFGTLPEQK